MSGFERPNVERWGRHPPGFSTQGWPTPQQTRPRPDFRWSDDDVPAEPHRQEAFGFLVFLCVEANAWMGFSWGRIALTVLEKTDPDRLRADVARWRLWRRGTLGLSGLWSPYPSGIRPELPTYAGSLNIADPHIRGHWGGERLQIVANGLHELSAEKEDKTQPPPFVTRVNNRERSPVFFPTKRLVDIVSRYRMHALPEITPVARSS